MAAVYDQLATVSKFELLKLSRRNKIAGVVGWTAIILIVGIAPVLLGYSHPANAVALTMGLLGDSLFGIYLTVAVCILAGDMIAGEFEQKTGFITFTNPAKRSTFLLGKFIASIAVMAGVLALYYAASSATVFSIYGVFLPQAVSSYLCAVAAAAGALGVVFFFSALVKGAAGATLTPLLFLGLIFQLVNSLMQVWRLEPWFILNYAVGVVREVIAPYPGKVEVIKQVIPIGEGMINTLIVYHPDILFSLVIIGVYAAIGVAASVWLLNRKELS